MQLLHEAELEMRLWMSHSLTFILAYCILTECGLYDWMCVHVSALQTTKQGPVQVL